MAYRFLLAAVKPDALATFQQSLPTNPSVYLAAEKIEVTTHYFLSAGTGDEKLDAALYDLLETGEPVHPLYWHPYRPPLYQQTQAIKPKVDAFQLAFQALLSTKSTDEAYWWHLDFDPIMELVVFASQHDLALVTFLEKPMDTERADKVLYPIDPGDKLPSLDI